MEELVNELAARTEEDKNRPPSEQYKGYCRLENTVPDKQKLSKLLNVAKDAMTVKVALRPGIGNVRSALEGISASSKSEPC